MLTWYFCKEFFKSGEFDEKKNPYAFFEIFIRVPIFLILDVFLIILIYNFITNL